MNIQKEGSKLEKIGRGLPIKSFNSKKYSIGQRKGKYLRDCRNPTIDRKYTCPEIKGVKNSKSNNIMKRTSNLSIPSSS